MRYKQKLIKINNSVGIIVSKQLLEDLGLTEGNEVYLEKVQDTVILGKNKTTSVTPRSLRLAESIGNRYSKAFEELAF